MEGPQAQDVSVGPIFCHVEPMLDDLIDHFLDHFGMILWTIFLSLFGPLLGTILGPIFGPELQRPKKLHFQKSGFRVRLSAFFRS